MAFQIDMSPLERSSRAMGGTLGSIGGVISNAIKDNRRAEQEQQLLQQQQAQQEQMRGLMLQAAQGDQQAIEQLYAVNPDIAKQFEDRVLGQQKRTQGEKAMVTADAVEKLHFLPDEQKGQMFQALVEDERYDIDEDDRPYFMDPNARKAVIAGVKGQEYADNLFGAEAEPMTEYQREMVKGSNIDRELRKAEIENKKIDNQLKRETSAVKLQELKEKQKSNEDKVFQIKKARSDSAQTVVDSGKSTLDLISSIEEHPGFESAIGAKGVSSLFGAVDPIGGTDAAGVMALIETLEAQNFLTAIGEFKSAGGAGSLSDNEGKKLGAALSNLSASQSEKDFKKSLNVIKSLVRKQIAKAKPQVEKRFQLEQPANEANATGGVDLTKLSLEELKALRAKG